MIELTRAEERIVLVLMHIAGALGGLVAGLMIFSLTVGG